eukprot:9073936-Prorocentrum_lima.AAC.1
MAVCSMPQATSEEDNLKYTKMDSWAIWLEYSGLNCQYLINTVREKEQEVVEGPWVDTSQAFST